MLTHLRIRRLTFPNWLSNATLFHIFTWGGNISLGDIKREQRECNQKDKQRGEINLTSFVRLGPQDALDGFRQLVYLSEALLS